MELRPPSWIPRSATTSEQAGRASQPMRMQDTTLVLPAGAVTPSVEGGSQPPRTAGGPPTAHAQQLVGRSARNSLAAMRSASAIVKYGAQVSARSSIVSPNLIA